jgi:septal ring factor EnvC (AmiA/AmiB activator)
MSCEKEHKEHSIIYFGDILPDEKKIKNDLKEFRKSIDNFKNEIEEIITKLNNLSENFEIYYSIFDNIVKANDNTKRNYQMLRNFKEFDNYINFFIKDINKVINDDNIIDKFNDLMDIDYKINNKDLSNKNKSENEKIIEKLKEEIKNFENIIENIIENNNKIVNEKDKNLEQLNKEIISMRNTINENFSKNIEFTNKLQANEKEINNLKSQLINKDTEINNLQSNNNYFWNNENQINYNYQPNIFKRQNTYQPSLNNPQNFGSQYNLINVVYHEDPFEAKNWIKCGICSNMNSGYKCSRCSLEMCTFCFSKIETKSISNRKSKHPHN